MPKIKIYVEMPGKARSAPSELDDEYTITVTRPDGFACTEDEARTGDGVVLA